MLVRLMNTQLHNRPAVFKHGSAAVSCDFDTDESMLQASYSGEFSIEAALQLGASVADIARSACVTVERLEDSMFMDPTVPHISRLGYLIHTPPGAYVVRPDQLNLTVQICRDLAGIGVMRVAFLSYSDAQRWAWRRCGYLSLSK
jgi:hypothetical protein